MGPLPLRKYLLGLSVCEWGSENLHFLEPTLRIFSWGPRVPHGSGPIRHRAPILQHVVREDSRVMLDAIEDQPELPLSEVKSHKPVVDLELAG